MEVIAITMMVLVGGLLALLFYVYLLKKRWQSKCQALEITIKEREQTAASMALQYQTLSDNTRELFVEPVTQLPTYKVFFEHLQHSMIESKRYSFFLALCLVEINNKHAFLDDDLDSKQQFLAECAQQLRSVLRKIDFLAHYEGNTFALLLSGLNKPEKAALVAQRIFDALSKSTSHVSTWNKIVSIGISIFPADADNEKEFIAHTLHALAVAKQKGRSAYQFYESALQAQSRREHSLVSAMNSPRFFEQLRLVYYPVLSLSHNQLYALSAELQWNHPELGLISPDECLVLAEKQNRLLGMVIWQLERACHHFQVERQRDNAAAYLIIPVPLTLFKNSRFVHGLQQWLLKWHFAPEWLCLEVSGDFNHIEIEEFEKAANMLHYLNIRIIISQCGHQGLPFSYFMRIPFTYYKLSAKMLDSTLDSPQSKSRTVLCAISQFMNQLSIQLIVSDVNIKAKHEVLRQIGVALIENKTEIEAVY